MSDEKYTYYQFRPEMGYQLFLRFADTEFEAALVETLGLFGFSRIENEKAKKIKCERNKTKILNIVRASARVSKQINKVTYSFENLGAESLHPQGGYNVYRYRSAGMMIFSENSHLWELGLKDDLADDTPLRVILTRFISFALSSQGVVGFWGVPVEEGFVVSKPESAKFESVFVDVEKNIIMSYGGVKPLGAGLQILRLDEMLRAETRTMRKEQLLSFLSTNTCYFSHNGFSGDVKATLIELSRISEGYVYPIENFNPRVDLEQA